MLAATACLYPAAFDAVSQSPKALSIPLNMKQCTLLYVIFEVRRILRQVTLRFSAKGGLERRRLVAIHAIIQVLNYLGT